MINKSILSCYLLAFILVGFVPQVQSQNIDQEAPFLAYLFQNELYPEAALAIGLLQRQSELSVTQKQRLDFLSCKAAILQSEQGAFDCLLPFSKNIDDSLQTLAALAHIHHLLLTESIDTLSDLVNNNEATTYPLALFNLFINNQIDSTVLTQLHLTEQRKLSRYHNQLNQQKSSFKAGLLSAIVPGLGRRYVGRQGDFGPTLGIVLPLAAVALEGYYRKGINSPYFIVFGGLFSIFYVGNIWGSSIGVYAERKQQRAQVKSEILYFINRSIRSKLQQSK